MTGLVRRWVMLVILGSAAVFLLPSPAVAVNTVLDGAGGAGGRTTHAIGPKTAAVTYATLLRVFEHDATTGDLRWGTRTSTGWTFQTLDGAGGTGGRINGNVGWNTALSVYGSKLHAFYFWQDPSCDPECNLFGSIREGVFDGATWTFRTIDEINCCKVDQSLAVAPRSATDVYLLYENYGLSTQNLRAKRWNGSSWSNVGCVGEPYSDGAIAGAYASAAVVNGIVRVTYFDSYSGLFFDWGVVHTSFDGQAWRTSLVGIRDGAPATSLAAGGLKVFVGDAQVSDSVASYDDLVLATPGTGGTVVPPDPSCG